MGVFKERNYDRAILFELGVVKPNTYYIGHEFKFHLISNIVIKIKADSSKTSEGMSSGEFINEFD